MDAKSPLKQYLLKKAKEEDPRLSCKSQTTGYVPDVDKQRLLDWAWDGYKTGQISADHTAREVFEEVVGNLIDFITGT